MDEFERIRRAIPVPEDDEAAEARALERLDSAIEDQSDRHVPRPGSSSRGHVGWRRRAGILGGIAAALALLLLVIQVLLPSGQGGLPVSAATELQRLAAVAAEGPALEVRDGFLYTDVIENNFNGNTNVSTGNSWFIHTRDRVQTWVAADGSGRRVRTIEAVSFPTAGDRAAWVRSGRPPLPALGPALERYGPGDLPVLDVAALPTDPSGLRAAIHSGDITPVSPGRLGTMAGIDQLLFQPNIPPSVRMGLFELMAQTKGVTLDPSIADPLGRPGESFSFQEGGLSDTLVVDPATARVLARIVVDNEGHTSSQVLAASGVVSTATSEP